MRNGIKVVIILAIALLLLIPAAWGETNGLLAVENKLIKIFVNNSGEETGRFAVDTTQGDPGRNDDNNKALIYGHPKPWTSFTTLRIDNQNFVFGKSTTKRAGAGLPGGEMVEAPHRDGDRIITRYRYNKIIAVQQILDITSSPSTGALDTARIKYVCENQGDRPAEVGLRILLDTMLGSNDGAPFRVGDKEVTGEYALDRSRLPDFWQAFDSLEKPAVIAQSTLKGGEITTPNRLVFSNWGKAADNPWEFPVETGADFTRLGEDELDSAVSMFWFPRRLNPGEQFSVVVYYGLGGITFAPGNTFLGISAPAEVEYNNSSPRNYSIVMYMEHHGETNAKNVKVSLELPFGLACLSGNQNIKLQELQPGVTKQFSWEIRPTGSYLGDTGFQIRVTGDGLESNQVLRKIRIIGPPLLTGKLVVPQLKVLGGAWDPNPLNISLTVQNIGESKANDVKAILECQEGLRLVEGDRAEKYLTELKVNEQSTADWKVTPIRGSEKGQLRITIQGTGVTSLIIPAQLKIPSLPVQVKFSDPGTLQKGQVFNCDIIAQNLTNIKKFFMAVQYNPQQLRLVNVSRGLFAIENDRFTPWLSGNIDFRKGIVTGVSAARNIPFNGETVTLARLNFIVVGKGKGKIDFSDLNLFNGEENRVQVDTQSLTYNIEEGEQ